MLHNRVLGDPSGRPVLFLHPGNAAGLAWADTVARIPGVAAHCPDLPGFGESREIPLEDYGKSADALAHLMREGGVPTPIPVVGYSMGAYTGMMLTLRHPDLVSAALLNGFQVGPLKGAWWLIPFMYLISPVMTTRFMRVRSFRALGIGESGSWAPGPESPCDVPTLRRVGALAARFDVRDRLPGLERPVTALAGDREMPDIRESVARIARDVPDARGLLAPGGHGWPAVELDLFAETVSAWLDERPLPAALKPA
ncbi:alpha/beta fold hydrolase [Jannaschia marina]|uniref:alpha/beta fold hydrolase n=1 Tax=Jannaschia marina TaxID=2741674 RepID=UPI0015CBA6C8|nr:alpha/beta hydrolase [Jannaschia marina]